jgi:hypothetical protein
MDPSSGCIVRRGERRIRSLNIEPNSTREHEWRTENRAVRTPLTSRAACLCVALAVFASSCGKKGPPLVPYVRVPGPVSVAAKQSGNDVYLSLAVPTKNVDASEPVSISRIEIFGYTGRVAPARSRWAELATLVARVPIANAPPPADVATPSGAPAALLDAAPPGSVVTVVDTLTPDELVEAVSKTPVKRAPPKPSPASKTPLSPPPVLPLRRFYAAFAISEKGVAGPSGAVAEFQLLPVPTAPSALTGAYTATELRLTWEPSGGALGYLLERTELAPEPSPLDDEELPLPPVAGAPVASPSMAPQGMTTYNVYRVRELLPGEAPEPVATPTPAAGPPPAPPVSKWNLPPPAPINPAPLPQLAMAVPVEFNRRSCYTVRAVRGAPPRESPPSDPYCVVPIDRFAPRPPRSLAAVAASKSISLIWEASEDSDVAGYVVLRGAPGDATLQALTPTPISEARYTDTTVVSGTRYVYAVRAVDGQPTPNVSDESERVEETAP